MPDQIIFSSNYNKSSGEKWTSEMAPVIFIIIIILFFTIKTNQGVFFAIVCAAILLVNLGRVQQTARFYARSIRFSDGTLTIDYVDFDTQKTITAPLSEWTFKLRNTISKHPSYYLVIYHHRKKIIVQRRIGDWTNYSIRNCYDALMQLYVQ